MWAVIGVVCLAPWFLHSWKPLMCWAVIISALLLTGAAYLSLFGVEERNILGVFVLFYFLLPPHLLSCSLKALMIYKKNGGSLMELPLYIIFMVLGFILTLGVVLAFTLIFWAFIIPV